MFKNLKSKIKEYWDSFRNKVGYGVLLMGFLSVGATWMVAKFICSKDSDICKDGMTVGRVFGIDKIQPEYSI